MQCWSWDKSRRKKKGEKKDVGKVHDEHALLKEPSSGHICMALEVSYIPDLYLQHLGKKESQLNVTTCMGPSTGIWSEAIFLHSTVVSPGTSGFIFYSQEHKARRRR